MDHGPPNPSNKTKKRTQRDDVIPAGIENENPVNDAEFSDSQCSSVTVLGHGSKGARLSAYMSRKQAEEARKEAYEQQKRESMIREATYMIRELQGHGLQVSHDQQVFLQSRFNLLMDASQQDAAKAPATDAHKDG